VKCSYSARCAETIRSGDKKLTEYQTRTPRKTPAPRTCMVRGCTEKCSARRSRCDDHTAQFTAALDARREAERKFHADRVAANRESARLWRENPARLRIDELKRQLASLERREAMHMERLRDIRPKIKQAIIELDAIEYRKAQAAE
jgi:chromosome segregation ATPase